MSSEIPSLEPARPIETRDKRRPPGGPWPDRPDTGDRNRPCLSHDQESNGLALAGITNRARIPTPLALEIAAVRRPTRRLFVIPKLNWPDVLAAVPIMSIR